MSGLDTPLANAVFDAQDSGLIVLDRQGRVIAWNAWLTAASGIAASAALGRTLEAVFAANPSRRLNNAVAEALEAGSSSLLTHSLHPNLLALRTRAGRPLIHDVSVRPLGERPDFNCLVQVVDVTTAATREGLLRARQNARYDAVVDSAPDAILTLDAAGLIQTANPAATRELGYSAAELIGTTLGELFVDRNLWAQTLGGVLAGGALRGSSEFAARRKDASHSYLDVTAARWLSEGRAFVTVILRDVNERKAAEAALRTLNETLEQRVADSLVELMQTEEALRQSQKMEAIGQLTGGIAHDFNNLLTGIIGAMDVLKRRMAAGRFEDVQRFMDAATTSANRAAGLTHRLLAFARRQPLDPKGVDVNYLVRGMEDLLRRTVVERIDVVSDLAPDLWPTFTDANQLENAVLNLVINARDAMPEGGRLTVSSRNIQHDEAIDPTGQEPIEPGDYTVVSVSDTGSGIPPELLSKVFDPFFTTKPLGEGTGLGLSMIYGFAKQSRGHVRIDSEVGVGTTVSLFLPRYFGDIEMEKAATTTALPAGSGETVLLVEDDSSVRLLIGEVLRDLGYVCMEATNGQAAMPILTSNARLDLLVTDVGLPGINGRQLAEIARKHRPGLKVLFVTGYAEHATGQQRFLEEGMEMVTKPFALDALALKIRDMLAPRR